MTAVGAETATVTNELASQIARGAFARGSTRTRRRGWLVRRTLALADLCALFGVLVAAEALAGTLRPLTLLDAAVLLALMPVWVFCAKVYGLYDGDEERAGHSTVDDMVALVHLLTLGAWLFSLTAWLVDAGHPLFMTVVYFWLLAIPAVSVARVAARAVARRSRLYAQNVVIVGAGEIGQLVARKMLHHPEYGITLVGFVDDNPRELRAEVGNVRLLGATSDLPAIVRANGIDRVVVAFSQDSARDLVTLVRDLRDLDVQIDIVPRLFDVLGPRVVYHAVEAVPLIGLPSVRLSRSSRVVKRLMDVVGALLLLLVLWPVLLVITVLIRLDSPGPALFRQTRLGLGLREFTVFKFRTMRMDTEDSAHREYIRETMSSSATVGANGIYKLDRSASVTRVGGWLRRRSLDELPQLFNVLRGDMSLVGPRPCLPYETAYFQPYQFERFLVPAGLTGLWQVEARAHATFGEALDMDVSYARGRTLGLDLRLLVETPLQILRSRGTA